MEPIKIKIKNTSNNPLPSYETLFSAGMDIRAYINETIVINPLERKLVPTGLYIELIEGYEAQIRPRSGLAIKNGITVLNSPGTIDSDYRGEIKIILINLSTKPYVIESGERIAQMIVAPHSKVEWTEADELEDTNRGAGGFGHTGVQ